MDQSVTSYIGERAMLLARLVLTRNRGVTIYEMRNGRDLGLDLFVKIGEPIGEQKIVPSFGVQVFGTTKPLPTAKEAEAASKSKWKDLSARGRFLFPVMLLVFSMEGDEGYYDWLLAPTVTQNKGPRLEVSPEISMHKITTKSLELAFRDVHLWYEAMAKIITREAS